MASLAYQVTGFAYQGIGQFAYQGSVDGGVTVPGGVRKRGRQFTAKLREIEKREDLGEFLKKRLNLPLIEEPAVSAKPKLVVKKSVLKIQEVDDNDMRKRILIMLGNIL